MLQGVHGWAQQQQQDSPNLQQVGVFGSYGRGTAAFGSDLDLILVDDQATGPQSERLRQWPLADLPLSCDALALTPSLLSRDGKHGGRNRWLHGRQHQR